MALPVVKSVADCANFHETVLPFVSDLKSLPSRLIEAGIDIDNLKHVYLDTNPFIAALALSLFLAAAFLIIGEVYQNYSHIDRFWGILPSVYNAHFAAWARLNGRSTDALNTILTISLIWSVSVIDFAHFLFF